MSDDEEFKIEETPETVQDARERIAFKRFLAREGFNRKKLTNLSTKKLRELVRKGKLKQL